MKSSERSSEESWMSTTKSFEFKRKQLAALEASRDERLAKFKPGLDRMIAILDYAREHTILMMEMWEEER